MSKNKKKTCFVVMGYGKKTDYPTGRVLDLNASYRNMIKPAVEQAGLECIRADEIVHSGTIDAPMYQQLLEADVVIADLSTANPNAFYELGVRHALRPFTTIIIAEEKLGYPFDVNHIVIRRYKHLGDDIGVSDAKAFSAELVKALKEILKKGEDDSPVYTYLKGLRPPLRADAEAAAKAATEITAKKIAAVKRGVDSANKPLPAGKSALPTAAQDSQVNETLGALMKRADEAQKSRDFTAARDLLMVAREMMKPKDKERNEEPHLIQRLAYVTYQSKMPTPKKALEKARDLLAILNPESSNDTETLSLWGAVQKRFWEETFDRQHLEQAIRGYEKVFHIRNDQYHNGINLATMLNARALVCHNKAEAIADFVQARRIREEVIKICQQELQSKSSAARRDAKEAKYWVLATMTEAYLGIGDEAESNKWRKRAYSAAPAAWMPQTTEKRLDELRKLLEKSPLADM